MELITIRTIQVKPFLSRSVYVRPFLEGKRLEIFSTLHLPSCVIFADCRLPFDVWYHLWITRSKEGAQGNVERWASNCKIFPFKPNVRCLFCQFALIYHFHRFNDSTESQMLPGELGLVEPESISDLISWMRFYKLRVREERTASAIISSPWMPLSASFPDSWWRRERLASLGEISTECSGNHIQEKWISAFRCHHWHKH